MEEKENKLRRVFFGVMPNIENKFKPSNVERKHLKAYLNGWNTFEYKKMKFDVLSKLIPQIEYYKLIGVE